MKKVKVSYSSYYDSNNRILGYVMAEEKNDMLVISKNAYNKACKRCITGAKPNFEKEITVYDKKLNIYY